MVLRLALSVCLPRPDSSGALLSPVVAVVFASGSALRVPRGRGLASSSVWVCILFLQVCSSGVRVPVAASAHVLGRLPSPALAPSCPPLWFFFPAPLFLGVLSSYSSLWPPFSCSLGSCGSPLVRSRFSRSAVCSARLAPFVAARFVRLACGRFDLGRDLLSCGNVLGKVCCSLLNCFYLIF